jgi:predicted permease
MKWLNILTARLHAFFRRERVSQDIEEELRIHLEMETQTQLERGMSPKEAQAAAQKSFGNRGRIGDLAHDIRGGGWMDSLWQDLRFGVRQLLKSPGFTAIAVLSLALGIGANTAIFSLIDALLLRLLPVKAPQELVFFTVVGREMKDSFSYPLYENFRDQSRSLTGVIASAGTGRTKLRVNEPGTGKQVELAQVQGVSGNFFSTLGIKPALGRTFTEEDDRAGAPNAVVVISHSFWQRRFADAPSVIGQKITIDETPLSIIGVAPPGFFGFEVGGNADIWYPLQMLSRLQPDNGLMENHNGNWLRVMGRLGPNSTASQAQAELDVIFKQEIAEIARRRSARSGPKWTESERGAFLSRRMELQPGETGYTQLRVLFKKPLQILMTIVALTLLIACANIANILLARGASRRREIAVRLAIGAGRSRLIRQLLTESALLAILGGALGILFAQWGAALLLSFLPKERGPAFIDVRMDIKVLVFTLAVSMLTGILVGLLPALRATRLDLVSSLKAQTALQSMGRSRLGLNKSLVVLQVALTLFLLIGAGLFVRSLQNLKNLDAGFERDNVTLFDLDLGKGYTTARVTQFYQQLLARLETIPGVKSASVSSYGLLSGISQSMRVSIDGYSPPPDETMYCKQFWVTPKYFSTMGTPLLSGRGFGPQDEFRTSDQSSPSKMRKVIINQTMARQFFGGDNAVGKSIRFPDLSPEPIEVIGVVKDVKFESFRETSPRITYFPYYQDPAAFGTAFQVRTLNNQTLLANEIRRIVREFDLEVQAIGLRTMDDVVNESLVQERMIAQLAGYFSLFALLLACIGLYGLLSYTVTRRTHEIGVRMALGARAGDVMRMVMTETLSLVCLGVMIGAAAALAAARLVRELLYGVQPADPTTITIATLLLLATAGLAAFLPARRAALVEPMTALRME